MGVFHLLECPFASKVHGNSEMHTLIVILVYYLGCILISLNKPTKPLWLFTLYYYCKKNKCSSTTTCYLNIICIQYVY